MQQDMIVILDLGSEENTLIARDIRALGVYSEIHPHDTTAAELAALPGVKGVILNGGPNRVVDGVTIDASEAVYESGLPLLSVDHAGKRAADLAAWPEDEAARHAALSAFIFDTCKAERNWNMENFIADQVELVRRQVGDREGIAGAFGWCRLLGCSSTVAQGNRQSAHLCAC